MAAVPPKVLARHLAQARELPPRAAIFRICALIRAWRRGDRFAIESATRPADVAELLKLAEGRRRVVELGTATGWTTAALVLADRERRVLTFDPVVQDHRADYLALLPAAARRRIELVAATGADGAQNAGEQDLVFVDSTHEHDATVAEIIAWTPKLRSGGLLVLHDYENPAFPGVAAAVRDLELPGDVTGGMFVWSKP